MFREFVLYGEIYCRKITWQAPIFLVIETRLHACTDLALGGKLSRQTVKAAAQSLQCLSRATSQFVPELKTFLAFRYTKTRTFIRK
jgi:hypothetical protein